MAEVARALSLLRQEVSITDEVLGALSRCQSGTILDASARNSIAQALMLLRAKEENLNKSREELAAHQKLHLEVAALRKDLAGGEKRVQECALQLTKADAVLRGPLQDAKKLLEAGRRAEAAEIDVGDVVDYAQRISGITSAPSYWKPGMAMVGFAPPAPRPEMMRAGALSAFAVVAGNSLPAEEMLRIAQGLDNPPQNATGDESQEGSADSAARSSDDNSSADSRNGTEKSHREGEGLPSRDRSGAKRSGEGAEAASPAKLARAASASFSRPAAPERPKISLDLDDLDSDSDEEEESD